MLNMILNAYLHQIQYIVPCIHDAIVQSEQAVRKRNASVPT